MTKSKVYINHFCIIHNWWPLDRGKGWGWNHRIIIGGMSAWRYYLIKRHWYSRRFKVGHLTHDQYQLKNVWRTILSNISNILLENPMKIRWISSTEPFNWMDVGINVLSPDNPSLYYRTPLFYFGGFHLLHVLNYSHIVILLSILRRKHCRLGEWSSNIARKGKCVTVWNLCSLNGNFAMDICPVTLYTVVSHCPALSLLFH